MILTVGSFGSAIKHSPSLTALGLDICTFGVGNVTTVTLNMSKDNVQFGLRAVDKSGHRSPAAFPQVAS